MGFSLLTRRVIRLRILTCRVRVIGHLQFTIPFFI